MVGEIEVQSISTVSLIDIAEAISKLEAFEISDFFLLVAERMDDPEAIKTCADRLTKNCAIRFGR